MGYDVSYHPISENEINEWYFDRLHDIQQNHLESIQQLAKKYEVKDFFVNKYMNTLRAGVASLEDENKSFDKTHGFYVAVVQGFFRTYFYTRGSAFSFLLESNPEYQSYTKSWQDILQTEITCPVQNKIKDNYCSGVYMPCEQVKRLREDYENVSAVKEQLDELFSDGRIAVFLKAVDFCIDNQLGMLEATEVAEPNPVDLNKSESYSDFFNHCDKDGPYLYSEAVLEQIGEALEQSKNREPQQKSKKGIFSRFFKK